MIKNKFYLTIFSIFLTAAQINSQVQHWKVFTNEDLGIPLSTDTNRDQILYIAEDLNSVIWVGTSDYGLLRYDGNTWSIFNKSNSPLPVNTIYTIEIDSANNKWIGTLGLSGGLVKYDDQNWTVWELSDFGIERTTIFDIEIDLSGNLWMGTYWEGLAKFDGTEFSIYNSTNTNLDQSMEEINCLAIDHTGQIWCGTDSFGGAMFDGDSNWTMYYYWANNIDEYIYSLEIDDDENIWFAGVDFISRLDGNLSWTSYDYIDEGPWYTQMIHDTSDAVWFTTRLKGFLKLDYSSGEEWTHLYPPGYDELLNEGAWALERDSKGNFWVGYSNGYIGIYNPDGLNGITDIKSVAGSIPSEYQLNQNFPNPFNPVTNISYTLAKAENVKLHVYDVLGREIAQLADNYQFPGEYKVEFDAANLNTGTYFYVLTTGDYREMKKMILLK